MEDFVSSVHAAGKQFREAYVSEKEHVKFARNYDEFAAYERLALHRLRAMYRPKLGGTRFLTASYFEGFSTFVRHQEIPTH
jgi:hypothetical protein